MHKYPLTLLVLRSAAVATLVIGVVISFEPKTFLDIVGDGSAANAHIVRYLGTALVGYSVINWLYSTQSDPKIILPGIYGNITSLALASVLDVPMLYDGRFSVGACAIFIVHFSFLSAFIYCACIIRRHAKQKNA